MILQSARFRCLCHHQLPPSLGLHTWSSRRSRSTNSGRAPAD